MQKLLYIGGGFAAGWVIGKMLFGDGTIRPNASGPRGKGKKGPTLEELVSVLHAPDPVDPLDVAMPPFVKDATLWSTSSPTEFLLTHKKRPIGVIEGAKGRFSGHAFAGDRKVRVAQNTTRQGAIGAVYAAHKLIVYLSRQRDYSDVTVRSSAHYEDVFTVGIWRPRLVNAKDIADALGIPLKLIVDVGQLLAKAERIFGVSGKVRVEPTLRQEKVLVPGAPPLGDDPVSADDAQRKWRASLVELEKRKLAQAKRRERRKRGKTKIEHKRRHVVSDADVSKLRKSEALTKEEKKALPKAKSVVRYSFALYGPDGSVGMYEAGSKAVQEFLRYGEKGPDWADWSEEDRKRLQERFEKLEKKAKEAAQEAKEGRRVKQEEAAQIAAQLAAESEAKRAALKQSPYYAPDEETMRRLLTAPEEAPSDAYFEDIRLESLDWLSRQRDQQYQARKLDALTKGVEELRKKLAEATKRKEAAMEKGDATLALQAVAQEMELRSKLDEMLKKLDQAQKKLHEK